MVSYLCIYRTLLEMHDTCYNHSIQYINVILICNVCTSLYIQFSTRNGLNRRHGGDDRTGKS